MVLRCVLHVESQMYQLIRAQYCPAYDFGGAIIGRYATPALKSVIRSMSA
jgi:hypothetical protein